MLEDGLRYYPHDQHSNMLIYIRIAAGLPKKTVRDVAHHLRHMQASSRVLPAGLPLLRYHTAVGVPLSFATSVYGVILLAFATLP